MDVIKVKFEIKCFCRDKSLLIDDFPSEQLAILIAHFECLSVRSSAMCTLLHMLTYAKKPVFDDKWMKDYENMSRATCEREK